MKPDAGPKTPEQLVCELGERLKELACLYGVTHAIRTQEDLPALFREVTKLVPPGWKYPEVTCCRVRWAGRDYVSAGFRETAWRQAGEIVVAGRPRGSIEVFYREERPAADEGPFLKEERDLINGLALALSEAAERQLAQAAVREHQEELARTEAFALVMVTHVGLDGRWLKVPPTLCELLGYTEAELLARRFQDVTHPDDVAADWNQCQQLLRGERKSFDLEKRYLRKDGGVVWVYLNCSAVLDAQGAPLSFLTYIRDITDRKQAERTIAAERARSDQILNELLPPEIAQRLKTDHHRVADAFEDISVLFADLVEFSKWSAAMAPEQVVELLNRLFTRFDRLARRHGVQKIGTQGDTYLAVSGLLLARPDHAEAAADLALEMCRAVGQFTTPQGEPIAVRIGIHTGPVVAGIIGEYAYKYDVWGRTVNLASRMESTGKAELIQVSQQTYERLRKSFHLEKRGTIRVKGFGLQQTYWLQGRKRLEGRATAVRRRSSPVGAGLPIPWD